MKIFDQVNANALDRRELHLWVLAQTIILVLATGVGLLMYPAVFSNPVAISGIPSRAVFFGFCGLVALVVGYFLDRQVVIRHLRTELQTEKRNVEQIRREASTDLLSTIPGLNSFCDRLAMEFRRASNAGQPLSLLAVELKATRVSTGPGEVEMVFGDAAKSLLRRLRGEDPIFMFASGIFGIVLPALNARDAYAFRDRLMDGLHDAAGASTRFTFGISVVNFPEHVLTAREMEQSVRGLLPQKDGKDYKLNLTTPVQASQ